MSNIQKKERTPAVIFSFPIFGVFGIHRFYLGQVPLGILYLVATLTGIGSFITIIVSFIDFIAFLGMSDRTFDEKYNKEKQLPPRPDYGYDQRREDHRKQLAQRQRRIHENINPHKTILEEVYRIKNEIIQAIENNRDEYTKEILGDIKKMLDRYVEQTRELVERDQKISRLITNFSTTDIDKKIADLSDRLIRTENENLKREYQNTINKYITHKKSVQELADQREMIKLRLESTVMSLKQIKFDLLKMEGIRTQDEKERLYQSFEEKTRDLSDYLDALKESYDRTGLGYL